MRRSLLASYLLLLISAVSVFPIVVFVSKIFEEETTSSAEIFEFTSHSSFIQVIRNIHKARQHNSFKISDHELSTKSHHEDWSLFVKQIKKTTAGVSRIEKSTPDFGHDLYSNVFSVTLAKGIDPSATCKRTIEGYEYNGNISVTISGRTCQHWNRHEPHGHIQYERARQKFVPEDHIYDAENYCRNPDEEPDGPWCYTTDPEVRWEFCDIPYCSSTVKNGLMTK